MGVIPDDRQERIVSFAMIFVAVAIMLILFLCEIYDLGHRSPELPAITRGEMQHKAEHRRMECVKCHTGRAVQW